MAVLIHTLSNGLRVVLYPFSGIESIFVTLALRGGFRFESVENVGISHLTEHLILTNPNTESILEGIGGNLDGEVGGEQIVCKVFFPVRRFAEGLRLFTEVLQADVGESGFKREQAVIAEEGLAFLDDTDYIAATLLEKALWGEGLDSSVENVLKPPDLNLVQFREFRQRISVGTNMVLAVVGRFKPRTALNLVDQYFGGFPRGKLLSWKRCLPMQSLQPQVVKKELPLRQVHCRLGFVVPRVGVREELVQGLLEAYLGNGAITTGLLFERLRIEAGLVYCAGVGAAACRYGDYFVVFWDCLPNKVETILEMVLKELRLLVEEKAPLERFERAKRVFAHRLRGTTDEPETLSEYFASGLLSRGRVSTQERRAKQVMTITRGEVQRFAQTYLRLECAVFALVGPVADLSPRIIP